LVGVTYAASGGSITTIDAFVVAAQFVLFTVKVTLVMHALLGGENAIIAKRTAQAEIMDLILIVFIFVVFIGGVGA
jgi:hypothetical protein